MDIKKYYRFGIVGIGIILITLIFWPKNKSGTGGGFEMLKPKWKDIYLPEMIARPGKVEWNIGDDMTKTVAKIETSAPQNETDRVAKILALKGIKITDINKDDGENIFYYGNRNNGMWNRTTGLVQAEENITSKKQLLTQEILDTGDIRVYLENILKTIDKKQIRWTEVSFKKLVYPRWVTSEEKEANVVEFLGNWTIDGKIVRNFADDTIKITTTRGGKILSANIYLLPEATVNGEQQVVDKTTLTNTDVADMGIVSYKGGANYELEVDNINIENVNVTQDELVYVYDGRRNKILPYFLLTGTSVAMGPVKVEMITGAVRE